MQRRAFLKAGAASLLYGTFSGCTKISTRPQGPTFRLTAAPGETRFLPGQTKPARVLQYNGSTPGPILRLPQGVESSIAFHNGLDEATTVHWHGLRIDNAMDGVPKLTQAAVPPGGDFTYRLTPPDAGTYWYHTHHRSWSQMAMGLSGVMIIEENEPPYVDQDIVCALDDWRLKPSGELHTESLRSIHDWSHDGRMGNFITVNGQLNPGFEVSHGERVRLRLVNVANARIMQVVIKQPDIHVVAIDGQPVTPFRPEANIVTLAPSQRIDLIIDLSADAGEKSPIGLYIGEHAYGIAHFRFSQPIKREQALDTPIQLPMNPQNRITLPAEFKKVPLRMQGGAMGHMAGAHYQGRDMSIHDLVEQHNQMWAFNGVAGLPAKPLFSVPRGTPISLEINNDNNWPHAMHIHGHHFIHNRFPGIWHDTSLFAPGEKGSMKFIADNPGKWLIHCHIVEHMAGGMVTWFEVT